jgi:AraC-like DNA-binding protein
LTGLAMNLNTPNVSFSIGGVSGSSNPLCTMIRGTAEGTRRCERCDRRQHARAGADGKARLYTCHAGFLDMAIPIMIQGEHVATISSGQLLPEKPSDAAFSRLARRLRWLGAPQRRLRTAYDKAIWLPRERLTYILRLLTLFARQLCEHAWRIRELETRLEHPAVRRVRSLVEERFRDPELTFADAAACAGLSLSHFSRLFRQATGMTFVHYAQSRRIEEAKHLLAEAGKSITEICFACGFNSLTHFNRVFRQAEGCSPGQYRRKAATNRE